MKKEKKKQLTSDNIVKVQITATMDDGTHIMGFSEDKYLINYIVATCQFARLREDLFAQCSLKELMDNGGE